VSIEERGYSHLGGLSVFHKISVVMTFSVISAVH